MLRNYFSKCTQSGTWIRMSWKPDKREIPGHLPNLNGLWSLAVTQDFVFYQSPQGSSLDPDVWGPVYSGHQISTSEINKWMDDQSNFFFPCSTARMILVPPLGLNPGATAVKARSHWTTRKVPKAICLSMHFSKVMERKTTNSANNFRLKRFWSCSSAYSFGSHLLVWLILAPNAPSVHFLEEVE